MEYFNYGMAFIYALMIGSFLNVVIYRVPKEKSLITTGSHCLSCKNKLKWYHNIPLFSWLFLRGKCFFCKEKISIQYPIIELLTALLGVATYYHFQEFSFQSIMVFGSLSTLLALSIIDIKYKMVPDSLNFLALGFALFSTMPDFITTFKSLSVIITFMGGFILLKYLMEYFMNKELLGEADIIVAGTIGALLGLTAGMTAMFVSALVSILPSLYLKFKYKDYKTESVIPKKDIKKVKDHLDLLEVDYSDQMKTLAQKELENLYFKLDENTNPLSLPFIPYLVIALIITMFFGINFYN